MAIATRTDLELLDLELLDFDLGALLEDLSGTLAFSAGEKGLALICAANPGQKHRYNGDPGRVRQILTNLIVNAIRHTSAGGVVRVTLLLGETLTVEVVDSGEGIAPEHLPHVFDRFYRADQSRSRSTGGSGLGLAIAQELANAHGGRLEVASVVGQGSTLRLVLPHHD